MARQVVRRSGVPQSASTQSACAKKATARMTGASVSLAAACKESGLARMPSSLTIPTLQTGPTSVQPKTQNGIPHRMTTCSLLRQIHHPIGKLP